MIYYGKLQLFMVPNLGTYEIFYNIIIYFYILLIITLYTANNPYIFPDRLLLVYTFYNCKKKLIIKIL